MAISPAVKGYGVEDEEDICIYLDSVTCTRSMMCKTKFSL